jgi:hypothetical protein
MSWVGQPKIIEQTKPVRLVCYKAQKFGNTPQGLCPFEFIEIKPACKNCVWFRVIDMSQKERTLLKEREIIGEERAALEGKVPMRALDCEENLR